MSGYSGTPLAKKLGFKPGFIARIINPPDSYESYFTDWPDQVTLADENSDEKDLIHFFTKSAQELYEKLPQLKTEIKLSGMIWVSWPKKASKVPTDVTEDVIRNYALEIGLVDIKVCAISEVWSGLKLVIPVKDRK